jgi:TPR repeat protein
LEATTASRKRLGDDGFFKRLKNIFFSETPHPAVIDSPTSIPSTIDYDAKPVKSATIDPKDISRLGGLFYLAESGDPIYLYEIGTRFESGHGVAKNLSLARSYYQRSSRAGYLKAQRRLERLSAI